MAISKGRRITLLSGTALVVVLAGVAWVSWDEILFRIRFESIGLNAQGYPEYRHRQTGIVFVKLPGGEFWMGSSEEECEKFIKEWTEGDPPNVRRSFENTIPETVVGVEKPRHKVALSQFLIAKYEVRQVEWKLVMGENPSQFKGDDLPVEKVTWHDCQEWCGKTGLSLPTEAQWEYACRAGTTTAFAFGETLTKKQANFVWKPWREPGRELGTAQVGSFEPNGFGLYNMHGNVAEWCEDVFDAEFYGRPEAIHKNPLCWRNPSGKVLLADDENRISRGGDRRSPPNMCRSAFRFPFSPVYFSIGFRPCYPVR